MPMTLGCEFMMAHALSRLLGIGVLDLEKKYERANSDSGLRMCFSFCTQVFLKIKNQFAINRTHGKCHWPLGVLQTLICRHHFPFFWPPEFEHVCVVHGHYVGVKL